jgi:hypothetical protein
MAVNFGDEDAFGEEFRMGPGTGEELKFFENSFKNNTKRS